MELKESLKQLVFDKTALKQQVFNNTKEAFELFRSTADRLIKLFQEQAHNEGRTILFEFKDHGDFEFEVRFGGDVLVFCMHTNVFEFSRDHQVMKSPYIHEDPRRSYCGVIRIYNFLSDSFIYQLIRYNIFFQPIGRFIGHVAFQDIQYVAFLYGLPHGIQVERFIDGLSSSLINAAAWSSESSLCLCFRCGGKCKKGHVLRHGTTFLHLGKVRIYRVFISHVIKVICCQLSAVALRCEFQRSTHLCRKRASLR